MKKVIDGKMYNTETANLIDEYATQLGRGDFRYRREELYKTKKDRKMNEIKIEYLPLDTDLKDCPLWFHTAGLQQTASGYGRKLTTSKKALYNGKWYRVYCVCFSNAGSCYIISKGKSLYLRG